MTKVLCTCKVDIDGDPDSSLIIVLAAEESEPLGEILTASGVSETTLVAKIRRCTGPPRRTGVSTPTVEEAFFCFRRRVNQLIKLSQPKAAVLLGEVAVKSVLEDDTPLPKIRGQIFERPLCKSVVVSWHPRDAHRGSCREQMIDDVKKAAEIRDLESQEGLKLLGGRHVDLAEGATVEDKGEMIRNLERRPVEGNSPWNNDRKYFAGWSDGSQVVLVHRNDKGKKCLERLDDFRWYFYVRTRDAEMVPDALWERHGRRGTYLGHSVDKEFPEWTRVHALRFITQTKFLREKGEVGVNLDAKKIEMYPKEKAIADLLTDLNKVGVEHFEADLTPRQRFMTDWDIRIEDQFRELYFDIETEDQQSGFSDKEQRRILSIAWKWIGVDGEIERDCVVLKDLTDDAEREMLRPFRKVLERSEVCYAWNGFNFDFPIIRARMQKLGLDYDWRMLVWCDLLSVWRRYFYRGGSMNVSFALGEIGARVLKMPKMDWKAEAAARCVAEKCRHKPPKKIYELWQTHRDILAAYNLQDVDILYELEKVNGFAKTDQVFCRIGNCMPADFHISTKIDMLMLKKGHISGTHFPTRKFSTGALHQRGMKTESGYAGGWVFNPVKGLHEDVAALDFKSLYPSMMTLFNISPDVFVPKKDRDKHAPEDLITCPTGATFLKEPMGFVPSIFQETLKKRKVYTEMQLAEPIGSDKFLTYYRLSYAYKRLGLSFYGELGNREGRYYNTEIAAAVTLSGQFFIKKTAELAELQGIKVLYGDTDSVYMGMSMDKAKEFVAATDAYYKELIQPFNVDIGDWIVELEYENHFGAIVFVSKKRYAGLMSWFKGKEASVLEVKGLEFMRSDGPQFARQMQHDVMDLTLRQRPEPLAIKKILVERLKQAMSLALPADQVQETKGIEKDVGLYKTRPPHVRVAEHIKEVAPTEYYPGMKVPYIMLSAKEAVWSPEYDPKVATYDPVLFWNKRAFPPTMRFLQSAYPEVDWQEEFIV